MSETYFTLKKSLKEDLESLKRKAIITAHRSPNEFEEALSYLSLIYEVSDLFILKRPDKSKRYEKCEVFLLHSWEAAQNMDLARLLAGTFHYAPATALLRVSYELLVRGSFLYLLDDREYCHRSKVLDKPVEIDVNGKRTKITLREFMESPLEDRPQLFKGTKEETQAILGVIIPLQEDFELYQLLPGIWKILKELDHEKILPPLSFDEAYARYQILSRTSHGVMSATQLGIETADGRVPFSGNEYSENAFLEFINAFLAVLDLGLILSFNILREGLPTTIVKKALQQLHDGVNSEYLPSFWATEV